MREQGKKVFALLIRSDRSNISSSDAGSEYIKPIISDVLDKQIFVVPSYQTIDEGRQLLMVLTPSDIKDRWAVRLPGGSAGGGSCERVALSQVLIQTGFEPHYSGIEVESSPATNAYVYRASTLQFMGRPEAAENVPAIPIILKISEIAALVVSRKLEVGLGTSVLRYYLEKREPEELHSAQLRRDTELCSMARFM